MKKIKSKLTKGAALLLSVLLLAGAGLPLGSGKAEAKTINSGADYGTLTTPSDMAFDADGNMYIANINSNTINKIDKTGTVTEVPSGGAYGTLDGPKDIDFDKDGNMYVVNTGSSTVNKITPEGAVTAIANGGILGTLSNPMDMEIDSQGNIYITNFKSTINKITPEGAITQTTSGGIYGTYEFAYELAIDEADNLYVIDAIGDSITKVRPNGEYSKVSSGGIYGTLNLPLDVEFDSQDNMYIVNANLDEEGMEHYFITKITKEGGIHYVQDNGPYGNLGSTEDVEFDADGNMYIVRSGDYDAINKISDLSGIYTIQSKNSNLLMDVYGGGMDQGVNVIQWPTNGGTNQQWNFELLDNGYYKITSALSGMSLDIYGGGADQGNRVIQWPYHGGTNQQWILIENEDGSISFMSRLAEENGTRYVLDVYGGGMDQGVNVIQWTSTGGNNQKWTLNPVEAHTLSYDSNGGTPVAGSDIMPGQLLTEPASPTKDGSVFGGWYKDAALTQKWNFTKDRMPSADLTLYAKWEKDYSGIYNIRSKNSDLVMDVYGGGTDQGVNVIQWPHLGQSNQEWKFESLGNGYYKVTSMLSEMSLDVYGGGTSLGNKVIQWPYHGGTNQQWKIIENADGSVSLMSRLAEESGTGYLLDVFGGGMDQGVNVIQWTAHFGDNQKWLLESVTK